MTKTQANANVELVSWDADVMKYKIPTTYLPCTNSNTKLKMAIARTVAKSVLPTMMPNSPDILGEATPLIPNYRRKFYRTFRCPLPPCTKRYYGTPIPTLPPSLERFG